jgi:hypothetical protein
MSSDESTSGNIKDKLMLTKREFFHQELAAGISCTSPSEGPRIPNEIGVIKKFH